MDDDAGVMNRSVADTARRGAGRQPVHAVRRHHRAVVARAGSLPPAPSTPSRWSTPVVERLRSLGATVATGRFRTEMRVALVNDGPVTVIVES